MRSVDKLSTNRFVLHFKSGHEIEVIAAAHKKLIELIEAGEPFVIATAKGPIWLLASEVAAVQCIEPQMEPKPRADPPRANRQPSKKPRAAEEIDATFDDGEDATDDDDDIPT